MKRVLALLARIFFALLVVFGGSMCVLCLLRLEWWNGLLWGLFTLLFGALVRLLLPQLPREK